MVGRLTLASASPLSHMVGRLTLNPDLRWRLDVSPSLELHETLVHFGEHVVFCVHGASVVLVEELLDSLHFRRHGNNRIQIHQSLAQIATSHKNLDNCSRSAVVSEVDHTSLGF